MTDRELEAFFTAARQAPAPVSEASMAQVLKDALAVQAAAPEGSGAAAAGPSDRPGLLAGIAAALGGWPAMSGLATAAAAGLWIGFSPALGVGDAMTGAIGLDNGQAGSGADTYLVDYATGYEFAFEEGDAG